jgi:hypothetical protein
MSFFNRSPNRKDIEEAHRQADVIKNRLMMQIGLGLATLLSTGVTALFTYYLKDLPASIRSLNVAVERLSNHVDLQTKKNKQLDHVDSRLERRLERLEDNR